MKILIAVNYEEIENYIASIPGVVVSDIARNTKQILDKVIKTEPNVVIISHTLPGSENIKEIISKLTSKKFPSTRIAYIYGEDDTERKEFINFLISRGIFDYHVGQSLDKKVINDFLFSPKIRDDVKGDILSTVIESDITESEETKDNGLKSFISKVNIGGLGGFIKKKKTKDNRTDGSKEIIENDIYQEPITEPEEVIGEVEVSEIPVQEEKLPEEKKPTYEEKKEPEIIKRELVKAVPKPVIPKKMETIKADPAKREPLQKSEGESDLIQKYMKKQSQKVIRESEIIKETVRLVGTIVIAYAGLGRKAGVTHKVVQNAIFASRLEGNLNVCVLDLSESQATRYLELEDKKSSDEGMFKLGKVDFYDNNYSVAEIISMRKYNYCFVDIGEIGSIDEKDNFQTCENYHEFLRANASVLILNTKPWDLADYNNILVKGDSIRKETLGWKLVLNFTDDETYNILKSKTLSNWTVYNSPYSPNFFETTENDNELFINLLEDLLPQKVEKKRGLFRFLT